MSASSPSRCPTERVPQQSPHVDAELKRLLAAYRQTRRPLPVSFRELLRYPAGSSRFTHNLHHYPARLLVNIPAFFLSTAELGSPNGVVLDPFCGSGTVLLEALVRGHQCIGADANPLARLVAKVKVTPLDPHRVRRSLSALRERIPTKPTDSAANVLNHEYWFHPHVSRDLSRLLVAIRKTRDPDIRDFFLVTFSACLRDVSLADPRLSVPVRLRHDQYPPGHALYEVTRRRLSLLRTINVERFFLERAGRNANQMEALYAREISGRHLGTGDDARRLRLNPGGRRVRNGSVDFILTSPPYVGAQKYIRASSLSLTWLGMCSPSELRKIEDQNIGREHHLADSYANYVETGLAPADRLLKQVHRANPLRAHIAGTYLREMAQCFAEAARVLRLGGHLLLVIGEGQVCGKRFDTPAFLSLLAEGSGLELRLALVDPIRSRSLMTKRNHTAGIISTESVLLFRKR
jgi:hypothetical protein